MVITDEVRHALDVTLNWASLLEVEVDAASREAKVTFQILSLPADRRVLFLFQNVGRVAASLRIGIWSNPAAPVVPFQLEELCEIVRTFGRLPVVGGEFWDVPQNDRWKDRTSLLWEAGESGRSHSISLLQRHSNSTLDLYMWFDSFEIRDPAGIPILLTDFCADGPRYWEAYDRACIQAQKKDG